MASNEPLEQGVVPEVRSSNYRPLYFSDVCELLRNTPDDLSVIYRNQFPLGKAVGTRPYLHGVKRRKGIRTYLDTGESVPISSRLNEILDSFKKGYDAAGPGADHRTPGNLVLDQMMSEFLGRIGASQSLVVLGGNCTDVMRKLVNAIHVPQPSEGSSIVIPSRAYKASATAVKDEVERHGIEVRVGQERGTRLSWIDIQRDSTGAHLQNIHDKTYLLIIQTGSNLYGTQATLGTFQSQTGSRLEGIVENIMKINQDRKQRGIQPLAVILDDAASRPVMAWRKPDGTYTQLKVDDFDFPAAVCYSAQKAYGDKGGVAVMNREFVNLTTFKPKKGFEGKARWRQLLEEGGATREDLIASLNYGTRLIEEIGIEKIMSHCIRGVYTLVDLLLPLVDNGKIEIISPRLRESGKVYSAPQTAMIEPIEDQYTRQLLLGSRIDPNRFSFNTITLRLPGKSPHEVLQVVRYLEKKGIRVGYLNLKDALPYSEAHRPDARPESVIRLTTSIFNNREDYKAVASCLTDGLRRR